MPTTTYKGWTLPAQGGSSGTWGTELNANPFADADTNLGGVWTESLSSVTPVTISSTNAKNVVLRLTGTITTNIAVTNSNQGFYYVENRTSGAFSVTLTNGVGSPVTIPQGYSVAVIADTTNGVRLANDNPGSAFVQSGASAAAGLVPTPGTTAGTHRFLTETSPYWVVPPFQWLPSGRLTLTSGTPVTTSNVTAATSVYYTPCVGNTIPIYGSDPAATTSYAPITFTEMTLALHSSHAANTNYDVFAFMDTGTVRVGTGPAWSSSTSRGSGAGTTQLSLTSGIWVNTVLVNLNNGGTTYSNVAAGKATYLGTIRTTSSSGQTEDGTSNRFISNAYNQASRSLSVTDTTDSWSYGSTTWRQANGSTSNKFSFVAGLPGSAIAIHVHGTASGSGVASVGVGLNSTTTNSAQAYGGYAATYSPIIAEYRGALAVGYYEVAWLESAVGATTWYGDGGLTILQSGMVGAVWA